MILKDTDRKRFEDKVKKYDSGCWLWDASVNQKGYGQFWLDGKMRRTHRVSYILYKEPIPRGHFVLHTCDNPPCVNPEHLFLGTHKDNMEDMKSKVRGHKTTHNKKYTAREQEFIVSKDMTKAEKCFAYKIDRKTLWNYENNVQKNEATN